MRRKKKKVLLNSEAVICCLSLCPSVELPGRGGVAIVRLGLFSMRRGFLF